MSGEGDEPRPNSAARLFGRGLVVGVRVGAHERAERLREPPHLLGTDGLAA